MSYELYELCTFLITSETSIAYTLILVKQNCRTCDQVLAEIENIGKKPKDFLEIHKMHLIFLFQI